MTGITTCWSCKGPMLMLVLFCPTCQVIQPPASVDPFTRLGMAADFALDLEQIEQAYFKAQHLLHPDRFVGKSEREKLLSQQQAAALNEAYETLRSPQHRAASLLVRLGYNKGKVDEQTIHDPELLMEQMELREALDDITTEQDAQIFVEQTNKQIASCEAALACLFIEKAFDAAQATLMRLTYLKKLAEAARVRQVRFAVPFSLSATASGV